ncbi:MAG: TolC family protein, partial [Candidatus Coatesbacteria bacterium]|nr:TolC family protein [Candidatus Coatesbacteria bacterium]
LLERHLRDAEAGFAAGTIARFEVLRAETQLANARQGLISAQNGVQLARAAFNNVLGRPIDTPVDLIEPPAASFVELELAACVETALKSRPEILQSEMLLDVNEKLVDVAKISGKPKLNFLWNYNRNFDVTMFNPRESSWAAFLTASMSIYDGGATQAAVDMADSDAETAKLTLEQVVNGVTLDAKQSYLSLSESQERIRAAETALEQARESMRLAEVRYKSGVSVQLELLDAQAALTLAETNHVNALYDYQIALAKLERAVGGHAVMAKLLPTDG